MHLKYQAKDRVWSPSAVLVAVAALMVLAETLYFASLQSGYSHLSNTISELGETGAPHTHQVGLGFFLPVGLLEWLALWMVHREASDRSVSFILAALSCLGTGYVLSALFPCDPGAPLLGSWRTLIHNVVGFLDYVGTGIGFMLVSGHFAKRDGQTKAAAFLMAGVVVLVSFPLLSLESFRLRGAVQRLAEIIQFTGVFFVCYLLTKERNPETSRRHSVGWLRHSSPRPGLESHSTRP